MFRFYNIRKYERTMDLESSIEKVKLKDRKLKHLSIQSCNYCIYLSNSCIFFYIFSSKTVLHKLLYRLFRTGSIHVPLKVY